MPSQRPNDAAEPLDLEQALQELEQSLQMLKARHAQVQLDQQRQQELQQRLGEAEQAAKAVRPRRDRAAEAEVKRLRQQLEEVELALESNLFSWGGLREIFWQAVRFGGLGIVIGWVLKSLAG